MSRSTNYILCFFLLLLFIGGCNNDKEQAINPVDNEVQNLTIFFINDQHGQLNNFAKIKHIVDQERAETNVLLVCAGDIFSGNPIVDQYNKKGYPMIDIMNKTGFDISVMAIMNLTMAYPT